MGHIIIRDVDDSEINEILDAIAVEFGLFAEEVHTKSPS